MNSGNLWISDIYPVLDNLSSFVHPKSKISYSFLTHHNTLLLAEESIKILKKQGIQQIIVSESGAVPFARICAWVAREQGYHFKWYSLKIPRDIHNGFEPTFHYYCHQSEEALMLSTHLEEDQKSVEFTVIKEECPSIYPLLPANYFNIEGLDLSNILESVNVINFQNCQKEVILSDIYTYSHSSFLSQILEHPFVYFDEYIDSGRTLFQTFKFLKLFNRKMQFRIFSYLIKLSDSEIPKHFCDSLFTLESEWHAYQFGVYPFENRIDWLGYFYWNDSKYYKKIYISDLLEKQMQSASPSVFSKVLTVFCRQLKEMNLLDIIRRNCINVEVANFIQEYHVIQYVFYFLEKKSHGQNNLSELLYQLYDMYGPVWSPMPDNYHFDYLSAFEKSQEHFEAFLSNLLLADHYRIMRSDLFYYITDLCEMRRQNFNQGLQNAMKERYCYES